MKKYTNLILLSLLVVLFYKTPEFLVDSISTSMGKLSWMVVIAVVYRMVDPISAIILAVIMITLLHQGTVEGYSNKKTDEEKTDQEKIDEMEKEMRGGPQQRLEEGDRVRHAVREEQHCERESGVARVAARVARVGGGGREAPYGVWVWVARCVLMRGAAGTAVEQGRRGCRVRSARARRS